ncbi:MAG TPA: S8 family serine peptidase [Pseudonocardiaceae bacterium]
MLRHPFGRVAIGAAVFGAMLTTVAPATAAPAVPDGPASGYIVTLHNTINSVHDVVAEQTAKFDTTADYVYQHAIKGYAAKLTPAAVDALRKDPSVLSVLPDGEVRITAQTFPTGINRVDGELSSTVAGNGSGDVNVDVAVIDTGSGPHADLNVVGGVNCVTPGASHADDHGHGTHVAGTVAARDDANSVVGVAPGARIWSVKVLNAAGSGSFAGIICGIDWVTARASTIEVANMSLGGSGVNDTCAAGGLHAAICRSVTAGVAYAVAAGNSNTDANTFVPATYAEVITVSAIADFNGLPGGGAAATCRADVDDTFADFSNHGLDVDITAPGVCILSTARGGGLATMSGTSMASPHAAGAAALYNAANPAATPAQIRTALINAGTLNWTHTVAEDPDGVKERLLNVDLF